MSYFDICHNDRPEIVRAILKQEIEQMDTGNEEPWKLEVMSRVVRVHYPHDHDACELLKRWGARLTEEKTASALIRNSVSYDIWVRCTHIERACAQVSASLAALDPPPSPASISAIAQAQLAARLAQEAERAGVYYVAYSYGQDPEEWEFVVSFHGMFESQVRRLNEALGHYWDYNSAPPSVAISRPPSLGRDSDKAPDQNTLH